MMLCVIKLNNYIFFIQFIMCLIDDLFLVSSLFADNKTTNRKKDD